MRWLFRITFSRVALLAGLVLFFVFSPYDFRDNARRKRQKLTQQSATPMEIALVWPATNSHFFVEGAELAVREINNSGGITIADMNGNLVKTRILMHAFDESKFRDINTLTAQIVKNLNLSAVIGHSEPDSAIHASITYRDACLLYLSPSVADIRLTQYGFWTTVQTIPQDPVISRAMISFALKQGWKKTAILYVRNTYGLTYDSLLRADMGELYARKLAATNEVSRLELVFQDHYSENEQSFYPLIASLLKQKFDLVILADSLVGSSRARTFALIYQLREMGVTQPILGTEEIHSNMLWPALGLKANDIFAANLFNLRAGATTNRLARDFRAAFKSWYTNQPTMHASMAYEAVMLLAQAAERAKSKLPLRMATMFTSTGEWDGLQGEGVYSFDEGGGICGKKIIMEQMKDGIYIVPEVPEAYVICTNSVGKTIKHRPN